VLASDGRVLTYSTTLFPGTTNPAEAALLTLASGESRSGINLQLRFAPRMRVSGIATGPRGPVGHLTIRLFPTSGAHTIANESDGVQSAVTDAAGRFTLLAVPPGEYTLATTYVSDVSLAAAAVESLWASASVSVGDADIASLALTLKPGIALSGRANVAAGDRVVVTFRPLAAEWRRSLSALVRSDGTFSTNGGPPGLYRLNVLSRAGSTFVGASHQGKPLAGDLIDLGAEGVAGLVVTLSDTPASVRGSIADATGRPDTDAEAFVFPADSTLWRAGLTDDRRVRRALALWPARYEIAALPPGDYYLVALPAGTSAGWREPEFLKELIPGATFVTLGESEQKHVPLRTAETRRRRTP
jgi:hypothetical protein